MSYTEQMENRLFEEWNNLDDYTDNYQEMISSLNSCSFFRSFGEGLISFIQEQYPSITSESAVTYIEQLCLKNGVSKSDIASNNTLKNWFKGGPRPKKGEDSRESIFALAFAMQLTPAQTAELFHKVYLDRAFDHRNKKENVYYFCLQHNKSWKNAKQILSGVEETPPSTVDHTMHTCLLKKDIDDIVDEDALIEYLKRHGHNMAKKNVTAKKIVAELITKAKDVAELETNLLKLRKQAEISNKSKSSIYLNSPELEHFRNTDAKSLNHLYEVIVGQSVRGEKGTKTLFKNARLPREIKNRFPEAVTLSKKDPTYEELRKLIILLASYNFWYLAQSQNIPIDIENYVEDLNVYLDESGFSLLYYGNPYDWLFMYCTLQNNPLDTFRGILAEVLDED